MKVVRFTYILVNIFQVSTAFVELKAFCPYGQDNGDTLIARNDDGSSGIVSTGYTFPFFDQDHDSLYVNTNGAVSFLVEISQYTPQAFPLGDRRRLIAPFWADVDTTTTGDVLYRETQAPDVLKRVSDEIRNNFVRQRRFSARSVLVVTWLNVARFGSNDFRRNTFQAILVTDGASSFSIFNYNKVEWTHGSLSSTPAQAGFNAGDGLRYFSIPNSRTPAIINITSTSNVGIPGKWVFQVDGETVLNEQCSSIGGKLVLSPRSGLELGGTEVFIGGPCYSPNDIIICRFNKTLTTPGVYINLNEASCITPPLYITGRVAVELSLDNGKTFNFTGVFTSIPLGRYSPDIEGLNVEQWANSSSTQLSWDPVSINTSTVDIEILLFDPTNYRLLDESFKSHKNIPNTGIFTLEFDDAANHLTTPSPTTNRMKQNFEDEKPLAIVRISPSLSMDKRAVGGGFLSKAVRRFSKPFLLLRLVRRILCNVWYFFINDANDVENLEAELPPCPTSLQAMLQEPDFEEDGSGIFSSFFHPGTKNCFCSRKPSASGAGQQCCYDASNRLVVGPPGGGTLDVVSPEISVAKHFVRDVLPWFICCRNFNDNDCHKYYDRRPSDDGSRYLPPRIGGTNGDPHLVTFDGVFYTFNGHGEYVLLSIAENTNLMFQGRMEPIRDSQGRQTKATGLTAIVIKEEQSDTVQVELSSRRSRIMDVFVNGDLIEFDEQIRQDFTEVFVIRHNRSKLVIFLNSGVSVDLTGTKDLLTYEVTIPIRFKEKTAGLLGYWDDNERKEFLLPNGKFVDSNSSSRTLHYKFGQMWMVNASSTLFTYRLGKSHADYVNLGFIPVFIDSNVPDISNAALAREANDICGDNKECLFDISVSGKPRIGQETIQSINHLKESARNLLVVAEPVYFGCDGIQDSGKNVDSCGVCGGNNSTCTDCNGNVNPGNVVDNNCDSNEKGDKSLKFYLLVIGIPVAVLLVVAIALVYWAIKRKTMVSSFVHNIARDNNGCDCIAETSKVKWCYPLKE